MRDHLKTLIEEGIPFLKKVAVKVVQRTVGTNLREATR